jgi:hypothetical protein
MELGRVFLRAERTWIATHPLNLHVEGPNGELTERVNVKTKNGTKEAHWPNHYAISAQGKGGSFSGYAIEIGEEQPHGDYELFKKSIIAKTELDDSQLENGMWPIDQNWLGGTLTVRAGGKEFTCTVIATD